MDTEPPAVRSVYTGPDDTPPKPVNRRVYLVIAVALIVIAGGAVVVATQVNPSSVTGRINTSKLPNLGAAPPVDPVGGWLNGGPPPTKGKVVIYDFWTYSCINCVRTIPYLQSWLQRYGPDGLEIVGIEAPEFDFEKVKSNVETADTKLGVTWPVALDNNLGVWNAFQTQYWPTKDIADRQGNLRYQDIGEGQYAQTEDVIRQLLGVPANSPRAAAPNTSGNASGTGDITDESYLGTDEGLEGARTGTYTYPNPTNVGDDLVRLGGTWNGYSQEITAGSTAEIVLNYHASQVNLVLAPPGPPNGGAASGSAQLKVELDGAPVPTADRGQDIKLAPDGSTYVDVTTDDMYRLILSPTIQRHTLTMISETPGLEAFDFTFGG